MPALEALAAGRHAAVITDFVTGRTAIQEGVRVAPGLLLGRSEQAIAVAKDNPALLARIDEALAALRASGELARISKHYFGEDITVAPAGLTPTERSASGAGAAGSGVRGENALVRFVRVLYDSRGVFLQAAWLTIELTTISIAIGCVIGLVFALLKLSKFAPLSAFAQGNHWYASAADRADFILYFGLTDIVVSPRSGVHFGPASTRRVHRRGFRVPSSPSTAVISKRGCRSVMTTTLAYRPRVAAGRLRRYRHSATIHHRLKDSRSPRHSMNDLFTCHRWDQPLRSDDVLAVVAGITSCWCSC